MPTTPYHIEKISYFSDSILQKIQDLFKAVYGAQSMEEGGYVPNLKELRWRFVDSPHGSNVYVAINKDKFVGLRPSIQQKITYGSDDFSGAQFLNAMTHPDYQRKGIYSSLLRAAVNDLKENNIHVIYTFPNANSLPVYQKLSDWNHIGNLSIQLRPILFPRLFRKSPPPGINIRSLAAFPPDSERVFSQPISTKPLIHIKKDDSYLNWRYCKRPGVDYHILGVFRGDAMVGYTVLRIKHRLGLSLGILSEFMVHDDEVAIADFLLHEALSYLASQGIRLAVYASSYNGPIEHILKKNWFVSGRLLPRKLAFVTHVSNDFELADHFSDIDHWYISFGDDDAA